MKALPFDLPCPDISMWRQGNTGTEGVWHFDSGQPGRHVLISALVHGNELCGAWALKGLLEAGIRPTAGKLTLVFANLAAFDRFDERSACGYPSVLDHYGAQDLIEFFAVSSEAFFTKPWAFREEQPDLYRLYAQFYRQEPAAHPAPEPHRP